MKSTPNAGAPLTSTSVPAGNRAAGTYRSRRRVTVSIACCVPESVRPAARICRTRPSASTRLAWRASARFTNAGAAIVCASIAGSRRSSATRRRWAATTGAL